MKTNEPENAVTIVEEVYHEDPDVIDENGNYPQQYWPEDYSWTPPDFRSMIYSLGSEASVLNQLSGYLETPLSSTIDDAIRATGIQQIQSQLTLVQNDIKSLNNIFSTPLAGDGSFSGTLAGSEDILDRAERILQTYDQLEQYANDILGKLDTSLEYIDALPEKIEEKIAEFEERFQELIDYDLSETITKLPELIVDKLLELDVVGDALLMIQNLQTTVISIVASISSLKAPTNILSLKNLISSLRSIISQVRDAKAQYDRAEQSIKRLSASIKNGNYLQLAISLAKGGVSFFEIPPEYGAKYPNNNGYKTAGGFKKEEDNTPGKQRTTYTHPAGTSVNINPDGSMVVKGKKDVQLVISENGDILVKKALTITVQGSTRIVTNGANIESSGTCNVSATGSCVVNSADTVSVVATNNVNVASGGTATVVSALGTEISSPGIVTVSGNTGINLISTGFINMSAPSISFTSGTENHIIGTCLYTGGTFNVKCGLITLN